MTKTKHANGDGVTTLPTENVQIYEGDASNLEGAALDRRRRTWPLVLVALAATAGVIALWARRSSAKAPTPPRPRLIAWIPTARLTTWIPSSRFVRR